jgi:IS5 family transposase
MRKKHQKQLPLLEPASDHPQAKELEAISIIIDKNQNVCDDVLKDLNKNKIFKSNKGANGMSADQVLRAAIVLQLFGFTYDDLAFHIFDSTALRRFCRIGIGEKGFKKSALNSNIKKISDETWEIILRELIGYAEKEGIEKGREVRIDCTVVESNIHPPTDATLLWDCVRVLTRLILFAIATFGIEINFTDHQRRAKRRMIGIEYAKNEKDRNVRYKDLLKVTGKVLGYAKCAVKALNMLPFNMQKIGLMFELAKYIKLTERVIDQTRRRVIDDEKVPASEKVFSIFEDHTDIIIKDKRENHYGHKICLTGGASNLIVDCVILEGNPADSTLVEEMLDRQNDIFKRYPLKVALDGGFASKENLEIAKGKEIKDVCFAKKRGLEVEDMCRSEYVYKRLRNFRAGIESGISWLKRRFGLSRCNWKGFRSFKCYVLSSIVAANLLTIARKQLAAA